MAVNQGRGAVTGLLLVLGSALYLYPFVRVLWRIGDEGTIVYGAQLVAAGALPFRDFFEEIGPGSFYWLGLFFKVFGTHWPVARGLLLVTGAATVLLMYGLTRRLDRSRWAVLPAAFYLALSIPVWPALSHHWDSNLWALLAVAVFCLWQDRGKRVYLPLTGVMAGITACFMQTKGLFLFLGLLAALVITDYQGKERKRGICPDLGLLTLGFAGVGGMVLVFFYVNRGLADLVYANLVWPLERYRQVNILPYGYFLWEVMAPQLKIFFNRLFSPPGAKACAVVSMIPFYLIFVLPGLLAAAIAGCSINRSKRAMLLSSGTLTYIILGAAIWVSELHRQDIYHLIAGAPLLLIISLVLLKECLSEKRVAYGLVMGALTLGFVCCSAAHMANALAANQVMATRRGNVHCFAKDEALDFLLRKTRPGEEVFIYPYYPLYYFLAEVKNPTRYGHLIYHLHTEAQFQEVTRDLEKKKVKYVLMDTFVGGENLRFWFPNYQHPEDDNLMVEQYLHEHYLVIGEKNKFKILQRLEN